MMHGHDYKRLEERVGNKIANVHLCTRRSDIGIDIFTCGEELDAGDMDVLTNYIRAIDLIVFSLFLGSFHVVFLFRISFLCIGSSLLLNM